MTIADDPMPSDPMPSDDPEFLRAVRLLRVMTPAVRYLTLYAANFWTDDRLRDAEAGCLQRSTGMVPEQKTLN